MRPRSRMAALARSAALVVPGLALGALLFATAGDRTVAAAGDPQAPAAKPNTPAVAAAAQPPATTAACTVKLQLQISGLSAQGCVIEIRPGHPGCKFKPIARKVAGYSGGETVQLDAIPIQVTTAAADRDCSFAITLREGNGQARTFRRGLRLNPAPADGQAPEPQAFPVFLSSPSLAAQFDGQSPVRR